jgi:hypothetical protein
MVLFDAWGSGRMMVGFPADESFGLAIRRCPPGRPCSFFPVVKPPGTLGYD